MGRAFSAEPVCYAAARTGQSVSLCTEAGCKCAGVAVVAASDIE